jgi:hypothetical protein
MRPNLATRTPKLASEILADFKSMRAAEGQRGNKSRLGRPRGGRRNAWTSSGNRDVHLPHPYYGTASAGARSLATLLPSTLLAGQLICKSSWRAASAAAYARFPV